MKRATDGGSGRGMRILLAGCGKERELELRDILAEACFGPEIDVLDEDEPLAKRLAARAPDLLITCEEGTGAAAIDLLDTMA